MLALHRHDKGHFPEGGTCRYENKPGGSPVFSVPTRPNASLLIVQQSLSAEGFEVLDDQQSRMIAKVKEVVASLWNNGYPADKNLSALVSEALRADYGTVSALFTATEGITLEQYLIGSRIETLGCYSLRSLFS